MPVQYQSVMILFLLSLMDLPNSADLIKGNPCGSVCAPRLSRSSSRSNRLSSKH